jgi:PAS domain S-box-containing protein
MMAASEKVNILMVDDQPAKLLSYEAILSDLGENLVKAASAKEALELLLKLDVAVVLMDVSMPIMNGFELAEMIRQHPRFQTTAIIFISAVHLTDLDRLKGYERGAVDYISVPVIPELLRAKVSVFAELHRKTQQLATLNRELEKRVLERTEELATKADAFQRLNEELARKHLELDAVVKTAPDIIFSSRGDGHRDYISDRFYEFTGATPGAGHGFGWLSFIHPEDSESVEANWICALKQADNYEAEYRMRGKTGDYRWFRARAVPIRDPEGKIFKWYGTCSDIHDSKLLEHSIREAAGRLEKMVDERTVALRHLSSRLIALQDEERRRIARELHDGLGQELIAAKMILDGLLMDGSGQSAEEAAEDASALIDRAIQQTRNISHLLHPPLLDEVGLNSAVQWFLGGFTKRSGIDTFLDVRPTEFPRLPPDLETAAFRIIQEALSNVFRHSSARHCWVTVRHDDTKVSVTVRDDGKGIGDEVIELQPASIGMGIGGMNQRVKELGGEMRIARANPGTLVEVAIPSHSFAHAEVRIPAL